MKHEIVYSLLITMNTFIIIRMLAINSLTSTFVQIHHLIDILYKTSKQNDCLDPSYLDTTVVAVNFDLV